jgi:dolichol-phosphate mannosyltransferase
MKSPTLTVLLPTYNEAENIVPLIEQIKKYSPKGTRILVVDDNSPDGTARAVRPLTGTSSNVSIIVRKTNRGLTNSINDGIARVTTDVTMWMDCDFSHPPEIIPFLIASIRSGADIAIASRYSTRKPVNTSPGTFQATTRLSSFLNTILMALFGNAVTDYTTGFLAVRTPVLRQIALRGDYGEYCQDFLVRAKRAGYEIREVSYRSPFRLHGDSKTAPNLSTLIRHGSGYVAAVARLWWEGVIHAA